MALDCAEVCNALTRAFIAVDTQFTAMIDARGPEQQRRVGVCNAGTCVVLGLVMGGWLYTAHVGDCRAVLGKASGRSVDGHGRARSTPVASVDELEESVGLGAARDEGADMQAV